MTLIVRYATQPCPYCGAKLDASMGFDDDIEPVAGDVSVCCACRGFLKWENAPEGSEADLVQRKIGKREFNELPGVVRADLLRMRAKLEEIAQQAKGH